jgi:xanthine dehydrogenase accessory factor
MNDNEYMAAKAGELIVGGTAVVLATIINLEGSSPRHNGSKMLVADDGKHYGTIGGSLLEATVIKRARQVLANRRSELMNFALNGKDATSAGMICGGKATVLLDRLPADRSSQEIISYWQDAMRAGKDFLLLTHFKQDAEGIRVIGHYILSTEGKIAGTTPSTLPDAGDLKIEIHNMNTTAVIPCGEGQLVVDHIRKLKTLYCCGAGHVAVPTCHIASLVGFRVMVMDDRAEYASSERFPDADAVKVIPDFKRVFEGLEIDEDSFLVIVTRGHMFDREVLEQSLKTKAGYIGMISSRRKKEAIFTALMENGVNREQLDRVHSPIGIDIGGETPEEIAVSIVAEMISVRTRQAGEK